MNYPNYDALPLDQRVQALADRVSALEEGRFTESLPRAFENAVIELMNRHEINGVRHPALQYRAEVRCECSPLWWSYSGYRLHLSSEIRKLTAP